MSRGTIALALGLGAILIIVLALLATRPAGEPTVAPSPTPSPIVSPTAASTTSPTASPSPTVGRANAGRFVSAALGYSIETPPPWRRTNCNSGSFTHQGAFFADDVFAPVSERDEGGSETGAPYATVRVHIESNPRALTSRQWLEEGRTIGQSVGRRIDDVSYAGRPAARVSYADSPLITYFVADRDRMFGVIPMPGPTPIDAAIQATMARIVESFRFLTDAELAAARAGPTPTPSPPRSPEQVADVLAEGFAKRDIGLLASVITPVCVSQGRNQGGGTAMDDQRYLDLLRERFARGLTVTVRPRPITGDRTGEMPTLQIESTWREPGQPDRELDLMLSPIGQTWYWRGTIDFGTRRP